MTKPRIIAASSGSITVLMPTSWAMTPPRSMSPTSTTGTSALRAKPILAMSALRRLTSAGLPAPSTSTRSARAFSRSKLSSTAPINEGFIAAYSRARAVAMRLPWTITCAPTSVSGLSSTGFMSVCGSTPAASAWSAWARPISPPSTVTAALFDMFCGLNGTTRRPRRTKARARPATMSDLPTSEPAPWIINARAIASFSELDAGLRLDAGAEGMLDQRHLGDEIGDLDQLVLGVASGEHDMRHRWLRGHQEIDNFGDVEIIVAQRDVDLVEHDHAEILVEDQLLGLLPDGTRSGDVAGAVLRLPGKAFAHGVELAEVTEMAGEHAALAGVPGALDELHDRAGEAMGDVADDHAEGRGRLALAGAGVDDDEALLGALGRHDLVAGDLLLRLFRGVTGGSFVGRLGIRFGRHRTGSFGLTRGGRGQMVTRRWFLSYDRRRGKAVGSEAASV